MHLHIDGLHNYRDHSVCMCSHGICPAYHAYECLQMLLNFFKSEHTCIHDFQQSDFENRKSSNRPE